MKRLALLAVIAVFVLIGCGGGGGDSSGSAPVPPTVDVTGTWDVSITSTGGNQVPLGSHWAAVFTSAVHREIRGHKTIGMTQRCAHLSPGHLRNAVAATTGLWPRK